MCDQTAVRIQYRQRLAPSGRDAKPDRSRSASVLTGVDLSQIYEDYAIVQILSGSSFGSLR